MKNQSYLHGNIVIVAKSHIEYLIRGKRGNYL